MKKVILTLVALMTMTVSFAENDSNRPMDDRNYNISFDMRRLAAKLDLNAYQMEAIEVIHNNFNNEMSTASKARGWHNRSMMVHQAVRKELHQMQRILNEEQFRTYSTLLGTTLRNQGL